MFRVLACAASVLVLAAAASVASAQETGQARIGPSVDEPSLYGAFLAGQGAIAKGDSSNGARLLVEAAEARPQDVTLRKRAFLAALVNGDVATAARFAPEDSDDVLKGIGRLTKAVDAMALGKGAEAETLLGGTPIPYPNQILVVLLKPYAAAQAGDWAKAVAPQDAGGDALVGLVEKANRARILELHGQYAEAEPLYRELAADPGAGPVFRARGGEFFERRGKAQDAIAIYDMSLKATPQSSVLLEAKARAEHGGRAPALPDLKQSAADAVTLTAVYMAGQRQAELALIYGRLALRLDPAADQAWLLVGDAFTVGRDDAAARNAWSKVPPSSSLYMEARERYAYSLQRSGDEAGALAAAEEAVRAKPGSPQAEFVLADIQRSTGKIDASLKTLDGLVTGAGKGDWRILYMHAAVLDQLGRWDRAEPELKRALELSPNEPELLNYLGYQWIDKGENVDEGLKLVERAVAARPNSGAMQDSLGWAHFKLKDYPKAVELLEKAVSLEAADPDINDHLGDAYWMVGRKDEAGFQWRRVLSLAPDAKLKASVEAKLKDGLGPRSQIAGK